MLTWFLFRLSLTLPRSGHVRITTDGSNATYVPKFRFLSSSMLNAFSAPQAYMQAPPPGQYPMQNGAGPRPSMPPTPIPAHAHPYYHQSPQRRAHFSFRAIDQVIHSNPTVPQAVPYPMMMPPPGGPGGPPHGYDGGPAPPVPMGGVGHA